MPRRLGAAAAATGVAATCLAPVALLVALSLAETWPFPALAPASWTARRWEGIGGGSSALAWSAGVSLLVSLVVAVWATAAGFITARAVAFSPRRARLLLLAYVPFAMSPVILGTTLLHTLIRMRLAATVGGVIAAHAIFAFAFAVIFFLGFWTPEKRAYEEMVATFGGSQLAALRHALLPLARRMLALCFFQAFLISWFQYGVTLLVGSGKVKTLPLLVFDFVNAADVGHAAVASVLLVVPPLLLLGAHRLRSARTL
jgi:putative spermidine/putrescine transport system permease protein